MKKTVVLLFLGLGCFILSAMIGSSIGPDGVLIEKGFFLIPLGYAFVFAAVSVFIFQKIKSH